MRKIAALLLAAVLTHAIEAQAQPAPPPLECPYCGEWTVAWADPPGSAGDKVVITQDTVRLPLCGTFAIRGAQTTATVDPLGKRHYKSVLTLLSSSSTTPPCDASHDEFMPLAMDIDPSSTSDLDAARADISLAVGYRGQMVSYHVENFERDDPCASGGASGQGTCLNLRVNVLLKALAYEAYAAQKMVTGRTFERMGNRFNVARFAAKTDTFCMQREKDSGGGSWPTAHAIECQHDMLTAKLAELREWVACKREKRKDCVLPDEKFDSSPEARSG